ncbi:MAG: hypothetical protein IPF48_05975 [Sphingomonadales bacterium]|nr:hypothetical protein [Sphingomonadales bacterium]
MARSLSQDLRDRVVSAIDGGLSCRGGGSLWGQRIERDPLAAAGTRAWAGCCQTTRRRPALGPD